MTLTKNDLVDRVIEEVHMRHRKRRKGQQFLFPELDYTPLSRKRATRIVETCLELIKARLERGEEVRIHGFGIFRLHFKWARRGRHPRTGKPLILNSRRSVSFWASSHLRRRLNGGRPPS